MKLKTSITLSEDVLKAIDAIGGGRPRSAVIEQVLRKYLRQRERARSESQDLERLNEGASRLNAEAADVLEYQASVSGE